MRQFLLIIILVFSLNNIYSQTYINRVDSLKNLIETSDSDTAVFSTYIKLSIIYRNINIDSALFYTKKAKNIFDNLSNISDASTDTLYLTLINGIGLNYLQKAEYDSAEVCFNDMRLKAIATDNKAALLSSYINLGSLYDFRTEFSKALNYHLKSLKLAEEINNKDDLGTAYNNVGLMHYQLDDFDKALGYYEKALEIKVELNDNEGAALLYNNIAIIYYFKDDIDKCLSYFKKALKIWEGTGNKRRAAMVLSNLGELYLEVGLNNNAINYLEESIVLYNELKDFYNVVSINTLIGQVYFEGGDYTNSDKYYTNALELSNKLGVSRETILLYANIAELDSAKSDYKSAFYNIQKYYNLKDSLYSLDRKKSFDELQTKYETSKKEQQLLLNQEQIKKQKIFNWALVLGILLVVIVAVLLIIQNSIRKKANRMLLTKNAEILQQKEEIEAQRDEIETQRDEIITQRDIAGEQRDLITTQKIAITDSIEYAKRIQNAVLPKKESLDLILNDYFILFKPKDVVSGDFYWVKEIGDLTIMLVSDCTGHGVPGGFMSMLGIAFLNEIVKKPEVLTSANLLNELRKYVIDALKQEGNIGDQSDGMDIAVCVINKKNNRIQYSGAFNPIYIVSERDVLKENSDIKLIKFEPKISLDTNVSLFEHKSDKMPIAHFVKMHDFKSINIDLKKGDIIYLFSDGYPDQFGGERGKKYNYKRFKTLLLEVSKESMPKQQELLESNLENWMGNNYQIDDITILGYRI